MIPVMALLRHGNDGGVHSIVRLFALQELCLVFSYLLWQRIREDNPTPEKDVLRMKT